jgi:hypothetical protein
MLVATAMEHGLHVLIADERISKLPQLNSIDARTFENQSNTHSFDGFEYRLDEDFSIRSRG